MNNIEEKQNNIEQKILDKIKKDNINPKPKWEFILTNNVFWILGSVTVILGAFAVAASIYVFENIKWGFYEATHNNLFIFLIEFIPYVWIILLILFLFFTYQLITKTKHGYKYDIKIVASITFFTSIILGIVFFNMGFGQIIDDKIGSKIPLHRGIKIHNYLIWDNPDKGLIVGEVKETGNDVILTNINNKDWKLILDDLDQISSELLYSGQTVRVIGIEKDSGFHVCMVLPDFGYMNGRQDLKDFMFERKKFLKRSIECEGLEPYKRLLDK